MGDKQKEAIKELKKQQRAAKRAQRKQNWSQAWQAFNLQRKQDKALIPIMLLCIVGVALAFFLIGLLFNGQWFLLPIGIAVGFMLAMFVFTRRLEKSMYAKVEDQPGVAGWTVENLKSGVGVAWKAKSGVAMNTHMDMVHRVIGVPGIVLVGEGEPHRVRPLMNQQKKRLHRIAGNVPIYEILVGSGEGQVPVAKLQRELLKLPRNYKKDFVYSLAAKVEAMDTTAQGQGASLPKGPLPKGGKMAGMNRRARRHAERGK